MDWIHNSSLFRRFTGDARYLVGVSGGRDSVALLHWLIEHGYEKLTVCHLNHRLRGRSSDTDARFVERLIAKYNDRIAGQALRLPSSQTGKRSTSVPLRRDKCARPTMRLADVDLELGSVDVRTLAKKKNVSIEMAAREARYNFFARVARRRRCRTIFLAHHADDLVETFLINLFRGSGSAGLAGMREISTRRIEGTELTIGRPFLGLWRREIDQYVRKHRLQFREDLSNKDPGPLRNRIRRRIIPYLERALSRNIRQTIWRAAVITAEEENWIEHQLFEPEERELSTRKLRELPVALQRRQILKWLRRQNIANTGFDVTERVRSLLDHRSQTAKINLPQDRHVRRRAGKLFVE